MSALEPAHAEEVEQQIEERQAALASTLVIPWQIIAVLVAFLTLLTFALTLMFITLWPIVNDTRDHAVGSNRILTKTIEEKDATISDQQIVISQAVTYITDMARQIEALGGKPPEVILDPNKETDP